MTCCFKTDMKILTNCDPSTQTSKDFPFNGLLLRKVYLVWAKKVLEELSLMALKKSDTNFGEKPTCCFKIDMRNYTNFKWTTGKYFFNVLSLSKLYIICANKLQRSYISWHWKVCKTFRETDLLFQNWHKEFDQFWEPSTQKSQKCSLDGFYLSKVYIGWPKKILRCFSWHWRVMQNLKKSWVVFWRMAEEIW